MCMCVELVLCKGGNPGTGLSSSVLTQWQARCSGVFRGVPVLNCLTIVELYLFLQQHGRHCKNFWAFTVPRTDFCLILLISNMILWDYVERDSFILSRTHPADHQWVPGTHCVKDLAGGISGSPVWATPGRLSSAWWHYTWSRGSVLLHTLRVALGLIFLSLDLLIMSPINLWPFHISTVHARHRKTYRSSDIGW